MFVVTLEVYKAHPLFPEMSDFQNENIDIAFGFRVRALKQMHLRQQYKAWISAKEDIQCLTIFFQSKNHRGIFFSSLKNRNAHVYAARLDAFPSIEFEPCAHKMYTRFSFCLVLEKQS